MLTDREKVCRKLVRDFVLIMPPIGELTEMARSAYDAGLEAAAAAIESRSVMGSRAAEIIRALKEQP